MCMKDAERGEPPESESPEDQEDKELYGHLCFLVEVSLGVHKLDVGSDLHFLGFNVLNQPEGLRDG